MKTNEADIFVFIACVIIGALISLNISFNKGSNIVYLDLKQYQDALNTKNKVVTVVTNLKETVSEDSQKLAEYKYGDKSTSQAILDIKKELTEYQISLGTIDVVGEGVSILINDAENFSGNYDVSQTVHNEDMIEVLNDLKNAGAEAISVNGQRITSNTEVFCYGPFLLINGVKIPSPFYLSVIGNKDILNSYMLDDKNYLKYLIARGITVEVEEKDKIIVPAF
jgi:uncharacterized protein YlxW (UPF0749 family)